jgi:acyl-CoA synthetase (AMP-forming)/AMP-acid ligase II
VATGYLDADATAAAFEDGWFRTGDLGRLEDGWLTITGRLGDRIIRGGENVAADEVERVLEAHPSVRQAVAVGVPDPRLGELVGVAVVVEGSFDLDECRRWFTDQGAGRLAAPERLVVLDHVPTLPAGKPDRSAIEGLLAKDARTSPTE